MQADGKDYAQGPIRTLFEDLEKVLNPEAIKRSKEAGTYDQVVKDRIGFYKSFVPKLREFKHVYQKAMDDGYSKVVEMTHVCEDKDMYQRCKREPAKCPTVQQAAGAFEALKKYSKTKCDELGWCKEQEKMADYQKRFDDCKAVGTNKKATGVCSMFLGFKGQDGSGCFSPYHNSIAADLFGANHMYFQIESLSAKFGAAISNNMELRFRSMLRSNGDQKH